MTVRALFRCVLSQATCALGCRGCVNIYETRMTKNNQSDTRKTHRPQETDTNFIAVHREVRIGSRYRSHIPTKEDKRKEKKKKRNEKKKKRKEKKSEDKKRKRKEREKRKDKKGEVLKKREKRAPNQATTLTHDGTNSVKESEKKKKRKEEKKKE